MGNRALRLFGVTVLLALVPAAVILAETDSERQAREDLEKQLKSMVATPPTKIRIELVGLDQPNYALLEASFNLDGRNLPVSDLKRLNADGNHLIFHGDVQPGEHRLESKLEFQNTASPVVSAEGGFKWKPGSEITFRAERGIEVQIKVTPELTSSKDLKDRIRVKSPATVKMLAKLDDGSMPEPMARPVLVVTEVDAGVVAVKKGPTAGEKAAALAEAKQKAREEALAAKAAAAEEKKRRAEETKAARLAAAEEKKAARLAAAEEKKRAASERTVAANDTPLVRVAPVAEKPAEVEAPVAVVEEVDAGQPEVVAVAPAPEPPVAAAPPPPGETGLPTPVLAGLGLAVLGLLLFFAARKKKE